MLERTRPPQWIVFDYGEVISRRTEAIPWIAAALGAPGSETVSRAYFEEREPYDRGGEAFDYWRAIGERVGVGVTTELADELTRLDVDGWLDKDAEALRLLDELNDRRVNLALLSNAPVPFARAAEREPWARNFSELLFSGDLKMAKPDDAIWTVLLRTIDSAPEDCLMFDDRAENVEAARRAGLNAEQWSGAGRAREVLRSAGVRV